MNTVFCSNHLCGKEYHESFKKCPFCGTDNPTFKETERESEQPKSKSRINWDFFRSGLRILICTIAAFVVLSLWTILTIEIGISGQLIKFLGAGLAFSSGVALNGFIKKKYSSKKQKKNDE
jgi:hypothetical protein